MTMNTQFSDADLEEIVDDGIAAGARSSARAPLVEVRRTRLADVEPERVEWLWEGYLPRRKLVVAEGDPGLGKSTTMICVASALSSGGVLPDGTKLEPADSLFITYEDGVADTLRPRAAAHGADLTRIHVLEGIRCNNEPERLITLPGDLPAIRREAEKLGVKLLVIDPFNAALSGTIDSYKDHDVRRAMAPLARLAEEAGLTVVVVRHLTKGHRSSAILAGGGSIGIAGAARVVLAVHRHPEDVDGGSRRVLTVVKNNLAKIAPTRAFTLVNDPEYHVARIEWGEVMSVSADQLTASRGDEEERGALDEARDFLRDRLARGPRQKAEILNDARREKLAERTVERAARSLGIRTKRTFGGPGVWELPPISPSNSAFGENGADSSISPNPSNLANSAYIGERGEIGEIGEIGALVQQPKLLRIENGVRYFSDGSSQMTADRIAGEVARRAAIAGGRTAPEEVP